MEPVYNILGQTVKTFAVMISDVIAAANVASL